jgi:hypothetical protein
MTVDQFVTRFARKVKREKVQFTAKRTACGLGCALPDAIRLADDSLHCPLSWVAGTDPCSIEASRKKLKLSKKQADRIATAADCIRPGTIRLRKRLLAAAGL